MKTYPLRSEIDMINHPALQSIDWEAVAALFKTMNWSWAFTGIPTAIDLRRTAASLISDVLQDSNCTNMGTGRITVVKMDNYNVFVFFGESKYIGPFDDVMMNEALE